LGLIKYLFNTNPYINLSDVNIFGGTSVGSFIATALSIGYNMDDFNKLSSILNINGLVDSKYLCFLTLCRFIKTGYLYKDCGRKTIVQQLLNIRMASIQNDLGLAIDSTDLTFGHLKKLITSHPKIYKNLIINMTDINVNQQIFMSTLDDSSSNIKIFDAMLASSAIPFVFEPSILYKYVDGSYGYENKPESTINHLIDGGASANSPIDICLLDCDMFKNYNLWLLKFTDMPKYVKIDGTISMLRQVLEYLINGKNNVKMEMIHHEYKINTIDLKCKSSTLDTFTPEQIVAMNQAIYDKCVSGELHFTN
jgi:hypothetical protein